MFSSLNSFLRNSCRDADYKSFYTDSADPVNFLVPALLLRPAAGKQIIKCNVVNKIRAGGGKCRRVIREVGEGVGFWSQNLMLSLLKVLWAALKSTSFMWEVPTHSQK